MISYSNVDTKTARKLNNACLIITDSDLRRDNYKSTDDITLESIGFGMGDIHQADMVVYRGIFGEKILKLRKATMRRTGYGGWQYC